MTESPNETQPTTHGPQPSTLIEFPGVNRNRPAWRKELSEKVREIRQRRAREAAPDGESAPAAEKPSAGAVRSAAAQSAADAATGENDEAAKQLGLVPLPEAPEMNPIVVAALRRIERARAQAQPAARHTHRRAQAAVAARVLEEQYEPEEAQTPNAGADRPETAHASNLVVVAAPKTEAKPQTETKTEKRARTEQPAGAAPVLKPESKVAPGAEAVASSAPVTAVARGVAEVTGVADAEAGRPQPRKIVGVIDDHWLERHGTDPLPKVAATAYDDRASIGGRVTAALIDLPAVALLCAPFAAVIELTIGQWQDERVLISIGGIILVVMFLYHTCAVALAGRTWGMRMLSLHVVDANTASVPTTWQCARRAIVYILSLATFGLGLIYALFDAEGRTAHDLLSRTVVVKE